MDYEKFGIQVIEAYLRLEKVRKDLEDYTRSGISTEWDQNIALKMVEAHNSAYNHLFEILEQGAEAAKKITNL
jgi:hypothetical protein